MSELTRKELEDMIDEQVRRLQHNGHVTEMIPIVRVPNELLHKQEDMIAGDVFITAPASLKEVKDGDGRMSLAGYVRSGRSCRVVRAFDVEGEGDDRRIVFRADVITCKDGVPDMGNDKPVSILASEEFNKVAAQTIEIIGELGGMDDDETRKVLSRAFDKDGVEVEVEEQELMMAKMQAALHEAIITWQTRKGFEVSDHAKKNVTSIVAKSIIFSLLDGDVKPSDIFRIGGAPPVIVKLSRELFDKDFHKSAPVKEFMRRTADEAVDRGLVPDDLQEKVDELRKTRMDGSRIEDDIEDEYFNG